jgi:hypothetical protein
MMSSNSLLKRFILFATIVLISTGCSTAPKPISPTSTSTPPATTTLTVVHTPMPQPTATPTITLIPYTPTPSGPIVPILTEKSISQDNPSPRTTIQFTYPYMEGDTSYSQEFNRIVDQITTNELDTFKRNAADIEEWRLANMPDIYSTMDAVYTLVYSEHDMVSIHFSINVYIAGAAHPMTYSKVVNMDLAHAQLLTFENLFIPGSNYLEIISSYCVQDLQARGLLIFPEGTAPVKENYQNWNIQQDGMLITFDPAAVAAYAVGAFQVIVPYEVLSAMIANPGPLSSFIVK